MIIGVVSSLERYVTDIVKSVTDMSYSPYINERELMTIETPVAFKMLVDNRVKKVALRRLEERFGTIIVSGVVLLNKEICEWILSQGGIVLVAYKDEYIQDIDEFDKRIVDDKLAKYLLLDRYEELLQYLNKTNTSSDNLYRIDPDNLQAGLTEFLRIYEDIPEPDFKAPNLDLIEIVGGNMSVESEIRKAMRDLGIDIDGSDEDVDVPEDVSYDCDEVEIIVEGEEDNVEEVQEKEPKQLQSKSELLALDRPAPDISSFINTQPEKEEVQEEQLKSVFIKVENDQMVILIPKGLKTEIKSIQGIEFNTLHIPLPDLQEKTLQEIDVLNIIKSKSLNKQKEIKETKPQAPKQPKSKETTKRTDVLPAEDLEKLKSIKKDLDLEIKQARKDGDEEKLNELKKERRKVRKLINLLG